MTVERWDDDRLDRFATSIEQGFAEIRQSFAEMHQSFAEINQGFTQVRQLTESNAKAIQASIDDTLEFKLKVDEAIERGNVERQQLQEAMQRLERVAEGLINITVAIDEDRPTMLRLLNSIENKVDRLLQQQRENREN